MKNKWLAAVLLIFLFPIKQFAQTTFPTNGANNPQVTRYVFINANIQVSPQKFVAQGILEIEDGKIKAVKNKGEKYDTTAIVINLQGKYVYASFIDIYSNYGVPEHTVKKRKKPRDRNKTPQYQSNKKGAFGWNEAIKPETNAAALFSHDSKTASQLRQIGFGTVATFVHDGIARGTSVVTTLNGKSENKSIVVEQATANFSFKKGSSKQVYPTSLMGSMALLRQTFYDAQAYEKGTLEETNLSLKALNKQQQLPLVFQADSKWDIVRIQSIAKEFNKKFIIKTHGDEYQIIEQLKNKNAQFIIPLHFPQPIHIKTVFDETKTNFTNLRHAEMAAFNPYYLNQNKIAFAFTLSGLKNKKLFFKAIKETMRKGLDEKAVISALTTSPANFINIADKVGTLEKGKLANFIITDKKLFEKDAHLLENWVQGQKYFINAPQSHKITGKYKLFIANKQVATLTVKHKKNKLAIKSIVSSDSVSAVYYNSDKQQFSFSIKTGNETYKLTGWNAEQGRNEGIGSNKKGETFAWYAVEEGQAKTKNVKASRAKASPPVYSTIPYNYADKSKNTFMVRRGTIWTNEKEGVLTNTDVLVVKGKIVVVGEVSPEVLKKYGINDSRDIPVINGTGKHLTAGIVDEHSHIAIMGGVNEGSQTSTAEVRIGDVINPDDINIYRQLAGGVTTSQLLHGSANVIGGQSAVIKLKWGETPNEMKFEGAPGRIKFALGENVKQSNWGEKLTIRFPQTRMGVEQVFENFFTQAKEYENAWKDYKAKKIKKQPRKNLELEALLEVINGERLVSCHSYGQQEINMLMKVAERHGFKINIFTHVLEGYKVADKLKAHGAGASTFSDWWGYKYEVIEASAYNAALLNEAGVTTCINSDDAEMGRRLNQEAAKTVKYGGVSEEDALKMVTLNPAILMGIANKVGSIKVGKDADLVLWSGHPLSVYSKPVTTFIEGVVYFDIRKHQEAEVKLLQEKKELIQKMNEAIAKGKKGKQPDKKKEKLYRCDDNEVYGQEASND